MIARLLNRIRALPAWLTRNGGYWGGIFMHAVRRAAAFAVAFMRRKP